MQSVEFEVTLFLDGAQIGKANTNKVPKKDDIVVLDSLSTNKVTRIQKQSRWIRKYKIVSTKRIRVIGGIRYEAEVEFVAREWYEPK